MECKQCTDIEEIIAEYNKGLVSKDEVLKNIKEVHLKGNDILNTLFPIPEPLKDIAIKALDKLTPQEREEVFSMYKGVD